MTSFFRCVNKRAIYRLVIISLAHAPVYVTDFHVANVHVDELPSARIWQHKMCATFFLFFYIYIYICIVVGNTVIKGGWNPINRFNPPHCCICRTCPTSCVVVFLCSMISGEMCLLRLVDIVLVELFTITV